MFYKAEIKDAKLSRVLLFHGLSEKYGWTFEEVEKQMNIKLNLIPSELLVYLRGIYAGEARYQRRKLNK